MLRGLPHSFEETAVLLSSFQHIKDQCFYFLVCLGLMLWGGTAEEDPRVAPLSSSTSSGQPVYRFDMCIYSFSAALWSLFHTTTASVSFRKYPIWAFFVLVVVLSLLLSLCLDRSYHMYSVFIIHTTGPLFYSALFYLWKSRSVAAATRQISQSLRQFWTFPQAKPCTG